MSESEQERMDQWLSEALSVAPRPSLPSGFDEHLARRIPPSHPDRPRTHRHVALLDGGDRAVDLDDEERVDRLAARRSGDAPCRCSL